MAQKWPSPPVGQFPGDNWSSIGLLRIAAINSSNRALMSPVKVVVVASTVHGTKSSSSIKLRMVISGIFQ